MSQEPCTFQAPLSPNLPGSCSLAPRSTHSRESKKPTQNKARQLTALAQPRHSCEHTGCPQHGARPSLAFLQRDDSSSKKSQEWDPHNAKQTAPLPVLAAKSRLGGSLALSPAGGSGGCGGGGEAGGGTHPSQVGGRAGAACGAACQGERRDPRAQRKATWRQQEPGPFRAGTAGASIRPQPGSQRAFVSPCPAAAAALGKAPEARRYAAPRLRAPPSRGARPGPPGGLCRGRVGGPGLPLPGSREGSGRAGRRCPRRRAASPARGVPRC